MSNPQTLADLITAHKDATRESYQAIADRAGLSKATVASFGVGASTLARPNTIEALAKGLRLPVAVVKAAAYRSAGIEPDEADAPADTTREVAVDRLLSLPDDAFQDAAQFINYLASKGNQ